MVGATTPPHTWPRPSTLQVCACPLVFASSGLPLRGSNDAAGAALMGILNKAAASGRKCDGIWIRGGWLR